MRLQEQYRPSAKGFRGYSPFDIDFISRFRAPPAEPVEGAVVDFFGMKYFPQPGEMSENDIGKVFTKPPFPNDQYLADGIEYAALALALQHNPDSFNLVEVGAGWGPWVTLGAICARRIGKPFICITAVEADEARFHRLRAHLALNGIVPPDAPNEGRSGDLEWRLEQAIAWWDNGTAFWMQAPSWDAGRIATALPPPDDLDYRGHHGKTVEQRAVSLASLVEGRTVDLLHVDIQGSEVEVIGCGLEALKQNVRYLFVGTHTRLIEAQLLEMLRVEGWVLEREVPCEFRLSDGQADMLSQTTKDGGQVWRNPTKTWEGPSRFFEEGIYGVV